MTRILIVAPSWVGDMVMAQSLFIRLKQLYPDSIIDVLAPAWVLPLVQHMPQIRSGLANPFGHGQLRLAERFRFARSLKHHYDWAIVLPNSLKSALIPWLAGIPKRTGFIGELRYGLLNDARKLDKAAIPLMVERFALLAEAPGHTLSRPVPAPQLHIMPAENIAAREELGLHDPRPVIALCPGAEYGPAKRWPVSHFAQLADRLGEQGYQMWIFGSGKDAELGTGIAAQSHASCINLCGKTSLNQALALMNAATHVFTNDSGLMHVAAALGKPLTAIYGSSSPQFTPPLSEQAHIVSLNLSCSPCFRRECPLGHTNCLKQLNPERILQESLLNH